MHKYLGYITQRTFIKSKHLEIKIGNFNSQRPRNLLSYSFDQCLPQR